MRYLRIVFIGIRYIITSLRLKFVLWKINNAFSELEDVDKELNTIGTARG